MEEYIRSKTANIISMLEHLLPQDTSKEELKIIQSSIIEIQKGENKSLNFDVILFIPEQEYLAVKELLPSIEENLQRKAEIIFRWFPGCSVSKVAMIPERVVRKLDLKFEKKS